MRVPTDDQDIDLQLLREARRRQPLEDRLELALRSQRLAKGQNDFGAIDSKLRCLIELHLGGAGVAVLEQRLPEQDVRRQHVRRRLQCILELNDGRGELVALVALKRILVVPRSFGVVRARGRQNGHSESEHQESRDRDGRTRTTAMGGSTVA